MSERRLAAILAADVVGYSRLIGADEAGTLARLRALRREVVESLVAENGGRIFKITGDELLAEFPSTVQALRCAIVVQERMRGGELQLRMGVHQGDVVVEGDDLLGDGVNVAARLEPLAEAGARVLQARLRTLLDEANPPNAVAVLALPGLLVESFRSAPPMLKHALAEGVVEMHRQNVRYKSLTLRPH
jgi:class 3 adenylate cyclase